MLAVQNGASLLISSPQSMYSIDMHPKLSCNIALGHASFHHPKRKKGGQMGEGVYYGKFSHYFYVNSTKSSFLQFQHSVRALGYIRRIYWFHNVYVRPFVHLSVFTAPAETFLIFHTKRYSLKAILTVLSQSAIAV